MLLRWQNTSSCHGAKNNLNNYATYLECVEDRGIVTNAIFSHFLTWWSFLEPVHCCPLTVRCPKVPPDVLIRSYELPECARASDERHRNADFVTPNPAPRITLSFGNFGLANFRTLQPIEPFVQRLHVGSRVDHRHQMAQSRECEELPVTETTTVVASCHPGRVCVSQERECTYWLEETMANSLEDGPLPPQQPHPRSVVWRRVRWEVYQQGRYTHECLSYCIALWRFVSIQVPSIKLGRKYLPTRVNETAMLTPATT